MACEQSKSIVNLEPSEDVDFVLFDFDDKVYPTIRFYDAMSFPFESITHIPLRSQ